MDESKIIIKNIDNKLYCEIYEFSKNGFVATFKFHYNGKEVFTKTEVINTKSTGLIEEINSILTK